MGIIGNINLEMETLERTIALCERELGAKRRLLRTINRLALLHSVGAFIDPETGLVYAQLANGEPELDDDQAVHVSDCCDEWFSCLTPEEMMVATRCQEDVR